jgi:hypothetical protein
MPSMNTRARHVCRRKLSNPSLLNLHCRTNGADASPFTEPLLKIGIFRFGQRACINDACRRDIFVAGEEIRQPYQLVTLLGENVANLLRG